MNPYLHDMLLAGMLGHAERFIGLRDEVELLLTGVSEARPKAISLVGPWGIGKSFLLQFLAHPQGARCVFTQVIGPSFADDPERLVFVMIDFGRYEIEDMTSARLLTLLYESLLVALAGLLKIPDARLIPLDRMPATRQPSAAVLRDQTHQLIRQARDAADDSELRERFEAAFGASQPAKLIELLKLLDTWGLRAVFLIDRFDAIAPRLERAAFDHLRALTPVASMVIATRKPLSEQVPAEAQTSPFFNLLERLDLMNLHFLSVEDARRMILEPPTWFPETADFRFSDSDVDFILELTGLHPDIIHASCAYLYRWAQRRGTVQAHDKLPSAERPYLRALLRTQFIDAFAVLWHTLSPDERAVLMDVARGTMTIDERQDVPPPSTLSTLINRGYVVFDAGHYRLFAGLFHDYVLDQIGTIPTGESPAIQTALTELESKFLDLLRSKQGQTVNREEIITRLYGVEANRSGIRHYQNRLDTLVSRLRTKLEHEPVLIENIRGQGYRLILLK